MYLVSLVSNHVLTQTDAYRSAHGWLLSALNRVIRKIHKICDISSHLRKSSLVIENHNHHITHKQQTARGPPQAPSLGLVAVPAHWRRPQCPGSAMAVMQHSLVNMSCLLYLGEKQQYHHLVDSQCCHHCLVAAAVVAIIWLVQESLCICRC